MEPKMGRENRPQHDHTVEPKRKRGGKGGRRDREREKGGSIFLYFERKFIVYNLLLYFWSFYQNSSIQTQINTENIINRELA